MWVRAWQKVVLFGSRELDELRSRTGPRCPSCGGQLIQRKVGFGRETGKTYWDCSNVPKCFVSLEAEAVAWPASPFSAPAGA
jgi:ssDNA-binding Zn-finger/Zn-ribbon topoisomerase 1